MLENLTARLWGRLIRRDRLKLHLGVGAGLVLTAGVLLAPRAPSPVVRPPEDTAVPLLREEFQRRDANAAFRGVPQLGERVGDTVVAFVAAPPEGPADHPDFSLRPPSPRRHLGYGLVVSATGDVLTHVAAIGRRRLDLELTLPSGMSTRARVVAYDQASGMVLIRPEGDAPATAARLSGATPSAGDLVVAVTRGPNLAVALAQPVYLGGVTPTDLALAAFSEALAPGTPLFDQEGAAVAVVSEAPRSARPAARALDRLATLVDEGRALPSTLGLRLQEATPELRGLLGEVAAVVSDLEEDGPAARSGLLVGDGLRSVNGAAVRDLASAVAAVAALPPYEPAGVEILRAGDVVTVTVEPTPTLASPAGPVPRPVPREAPAAGRLFPLEALVTSGVPADATVLRLDGRARPERAARAHLRRTKGPWLLYLAHDGQRYFAVVEPRP